MFFIVLGVALMLLKYTEIGPTAAWSWYICLAPFGAAALWWAFADASGITARQQADRTDERAQKRRDDHAEAIGVPKHMIEARRKAQLAKASAAQRVRR
jgi:small Trp-rich protein